MRVAIAGGSGLIGRRLTEVLEAKGHEVIWLSRNPRSSREIEWLGPARSWHNEVRASDAVVNLAGRSISAKWSAETRREILNSRVVPTQALAECLAQPGKVQTWINASAVGYYGDRGAERLTESSSAGTGFLAETCVKWENAFFRPSLTVRRIAIRTGVALSMQGGALPVLHMLTRLGLGGQAGSGQQYMPWIHLDDLAEMFAFCLEQEQIQGPINGTSLHSATNQKFMATLRDVAGRPWSPPVPSIVLQAVGKLIGPDAALILGSTNVAPSVAIKHQFPFTYSDLTVALRDLIGRQV